MSRDEEVLVSLYTLRQDLLKQLAEVDTNIRNAEARIHEKNETSANITLQEPHSKNAGAGKLTQLIARCMQDANGLRDGLKMIDAFKGFPESTSDDEVSRQRNYLRNVFVHQSIAHAQDLSTDPNGSEFMQHLVTMLASGDAPPTLHDVNYNIAHPAPGESISEVMLLIQHLGDRLVPISCSTCGTRMTNRIVDQLVSVNEFAAFSKAISPSVVEIAKDINGNHILTKLIASDKLRFLGQDIDDPEQQAAVHAIREAIYAPITEHCIDICKNRQGCCVIQKCLQWAPKEYHTRIISTVLHNSLKLVQDPFGNYVVQFILDRQQDISHHSEDGEVPNYTNQIIRQMLHHVVALSCNKFSSNVIEKCLKTASPDVRQLLVDELTEPLALPKLLTDSFANYVIQTAIATASDDSQFAQLRESIMPLQNLLKNSPYGVKIEAKLSRRHRESTRRQTKKRDAAVPGIQMKPEDAIGHPFIANAPPGIPTLMPHNAMGQQVAFNIPQDMTPFFQPQPMLNSMPFVLQGPQPVIGIPSAQPQPPFSMNMVNPNGMSPEYQ